MKDDYLIKCRRAEYIVQGRSRVIAGKEDIRLDSATLRELVRCKDCKYRGVGDYCVYGTRLAWVTKSNDFCSMGRKENR